MAIQGILDESRDFYQTQYDEVTARLLHIPRGSLRSKRVGDKSYRYLRRYVQGKGYEDAYIGPAGTPGTDALIEFVKERKKRVEERNIIKASLAALGVKNVELQEKGYHRIFTRLADEFGKVGLWEEGLMLIGSWCFSVYVQTFGVEFFPLRTMDFDFALRIPYTGDKADIDRLLRDLGFTVRIDMAYDKIDYAMPGVGMVEVFIDREKADPEQLKRLKQDLALRPAAVSYLQILTDHPVTTAVRGVHKAITLPSMPAFFVHRLVAARFGEYRDPVQHPAKIRKDYKQAALVAKKISGDSRLQEELRQIVDSLSEDLRKKMQQGAEAAEGFIRAPDLTDEDISYIQRAAHIATTNGR